LPGVRRTKEVYLIHQPPGERKIGMKRGLKKRGKKREECSGNFVACRQERKKGEEDGGRGN